MTSSNGSSPAPASSSPADSMRDSNTGPSEASVPAGRPTFCPTQRLLFVLGKGGVGRSTVCGSLGLALAQKGARVLIVQWTLADSLSKAFSMPSAHHDAHELAPGLFTMNFNADEAMREYFVEHLGMRLLHKVVIENRHVQKFLQASPGVQELFFLGRLYWLIELAKKERGIEYDFVLVDTPATGHGVSLFTIAPTVASFGITGPLASECERVARLLGDPTKTGTLVVTLPEELPVEETVEFVPRVSRELGREPLAVFVNRSTGPSFAQPQGQIEGSPWFQGLLGRLTSETARGEARVFLYDLTKRVLFGNRLRETLLEKGIRAPVFDLPDVQLERPEAGPHDVLARLTRSFAALCRAPESTSPMRSPVS